MKTTHEIRQLVKSVNPDASVSSPEPGYFTIRTYHAVDKVEDAIRRSGLTIIETEITGSRHNWVHVITAIRGGLA